MKHVICLAILLARGFDVEAAPHLSLTPDIVSVSSIDGPYEADMSNRVRSRAIVKYALGGEGTQSLVLERFAPGRYGSPDKILFQREFAIPSLPGLKEHMATISMKSPEAGYGCCNVSNFTWEQARLTFDVSHDTIHFACETTPFANETFKVTCAKK